MTTSYYMYSRIRNYSTDNMLTWLNDSMVKRFQFSSQSTQYVFIGVLHISVLFVDVWCLFDDYLMNETRRKPTTGRQSPSLCDKWHGIFYMPSRIDTVIHTKAFDYPVAEHGGGKCSAPRGLEPTVERATNWATPVPPEDHITPGPQQRGSSPNWGIVGKEQPRPEKAIPMGPFTFQRGYL